MDRHALSLEAPAVVVRPSEAGADRTAEVDESLAEPRPGVIAGVLRLLPIAAIVVATVLLGARVIGASDVGVVHVIALAAILATAAGQTALMRERRRLLLLSRRAKADLEVAHVQRADADSRYRVLVEHVPAAVYIDVEDPDISDGGRLEYMSPVVEVMLGYTAQEFIDDPELWPHLIHEADRAQALAAYAQHWASGQPLRIDYRMVARDGTVRWVRDEAYSLPDQAIGRRRVSQGLLVDTSEQKRLEAQLVHDALHDPLTGLANRVLFRDHVERALARRRRGRKSLAVLFLDLDDFKLVNDSLGHRAGDRLLVEVARRISATIRAGDIAGRQGGDEFTVLLENVAGPAGALATAERLAEELRRPIEIEGRSLVIKTSLGIAIAEGRDAAADDLLANADAAMYVAKSQGKACHAMFDPSMRMRARRRLEREEELRRAIVEELFELHYQPIVELGSNRIVAFEALARWRHPERGLLGPNEFIPMAEATGMIVPLGQLVTESACRQLAAWRQMPGWEDLNLNINVSVRQAVEPGFAGMVAGALQASHVAPSGIVLEITESLMLHESITTHGSLRQLRDLGLGLVVDDFGTGFSALDYFKRFAVQGLKIDRSFVGGLGRSREDTAIVTATLAFASALDLWVTAEGVQTVDQAQRLEALGCGYAQGFLFGRPMPAEDVTELLSGGRVPLPRIQAA